MAHVRSTPESGHVRCNYGCPLCAKSRQSACEVLPIQRFAKTHLNNQFLPAFAVVSLSITSLTLKLAGFVRGGKSLKLSSHCPTKACAGTSKNIRWAVQSAYSMLSGPRSNGSARKL